MESLKGEVEIRRRKLEVRSERLEIKVGRGIRSRYLNRKRKLKSKKFAERNGK